MRTVVVIGSRHRSWKEKGSHEEFIGHLIQDRVKAHGGALTVTSLGCDMGFGKAVKVYCEEEGVKFFEFVVYFNGPRPRDEYADCYRARHAALLEIGSEYYMFTTTEGQTHLDDLLERVRSSGKPYYMFDKNYVLIEYRAVTDGAEPDFTVHAQAS